MTDTREEEANRLCMKLLGYIPTTDLLHALHQHNPGALMLLLSVIDKNYFNRHNKKEIY